MTKEQTAPLKRRKNKDGVEKNTPEDGVKEKEKVEMEKTGGGIKEIGSVVELPRMRE